MNLLLNSTNLSTDDFSTCNENGHINRQQFTLEIT
jgi:hypothetical protein